MIGQTISHYRIVEKLGAGGMGVVYEAEDIRLGRRVALKFLPQNFSRDPKALRRFEREARAASSLNHPNICTIYEVEEHDGQPVIVMELLEGESVKERMRRESLSIDEILDIGIQTAEGLSAAHIKGIIHRDIKPGNIFIGPERVKILDFGLAKVVPGSLSENQADEESLTVDGMIPGTTAYMSPEQVRGDDLDPRSDLFSLGVVLYEIATGRQPFLGKNRVLLMDAILNGREAAPREANPALPEPMELIITRLLQKDRRHRYESAADLCSDLKRVKAGIESARFTAAGASTAKLGKDLQRLKRDTGSGQPPVPTVAVNRTETTKRKRMTAIVLVPTVLVLLVGTIAAFGYWWAVAAQPPRAVSYTQITHDGRRKHATGTEQTGSVTDGPRVFFTEGKGDNGLTPAPAQVSSEGGETVPVPVPFGASLVVDISTSRSELLVTTYSDDADEDHALWAVPVLGGSPRRMGSANSVFAAWSPDSKKLVFAQGSDLYLANYDGENPQKLVTVPGVPGWVEPYIPGWPRWSPDSKRIRFSLQDPKTLSFALWEVSADGSNLHQLLPGWNDPPAECCGVWTPDGRYFIFQSTRNGRTDLWAMREKTSLFQRAKREPTPLTSGPMSFLGPNLSRDGRLFALGVQTKNELVRYDLRSRQLQLYLSGISAEGVDFSKDGQSLTYVAIPEGTLWTSRVDGSERLQLTFPPLQVALPRWSPAGKQIAFMGRLPGHLWQIYVLPADGGNPLQVVSDDENEAEPNWSPDGRSLLYSQLPTMHVNTAKKIVIHALDLTTHQVSTLPGSEGLYSARWSPDGRYILASTTDDSSLMGFKLGTRRWTMASQPGGRILGWARQDGQVYFEDSGDIYRLRFPQGHRQQLASVKDIQRGTGILGFNAWAGLDSEDSILLVREASSEELYAIKWVAP